MRNERHALVACDACGRSDRDDMMACDMWGGVGAVWNWKVVEEGRGGWVG